MKVLDLPQGSEEWKAERRKYATASDMPSILGVRGAFSSRKRLLKEKQSGVDKQISPSTQAIFDRGHEVEAELRVWCEAQLGMSLDPIVMLDEKRGILASIDGYNKEYGIIVETKNSWSEGKLELARRYEVWEPYRVQVITQMLVAKVDIAFLCMRDDTCGENFLIPVEEDKKLMRKITAEAKKFVKELKNE